MCDAIGRALVAHVREPSAPARVDSRRPAVERARRFRQLLRRMFRSVRADAGRWRRWLALRARRPLPALAMPFLLLWLAAPLIAWRISRTPPRGGEVRPVGRAAARAAADRAAHLALLRDLRDGRRQPPAARQLPGRPARRRRAPHLAHQHRPLSAVDVAARDFGWCGLRDALDRIEATLGTLVRMHKCRGHLYNWYDTRDLRPLEPRYVSSVDSGNLAAHLITLAGAFREWQKESAAARLEAVDGLADALDLARVALRNFKFAPGQTITLGLLETAFADLEASLRPRTMPLDPKTDALREAAERASTLVDMVRTLAQREPTRSASAELVYWVEATRRTIDSWRSDLLARDPAGFIVEHLESLANIALQLAAPWNSTSCSTRSASCCRSAIAPPTARSIDSCYDLLASEARLASFIAIAKGDIPARHWFRLGRTVTPIGAGAALVSWSGSMFEYLMPDLVLRAPGGSLLAQTSRLIVKRQIAYGAELDLPWGVSESAYNARDLELTYQYSNFGVPGLGLKRGLSENKVVAPYATGLAAMVDGEAALANYRGARRASARAARYGFYEAVDFTAEPRSRGRLARAGARLHGASPGHEHRRHRQRAARRPHARTLPFRRRGAGHRAAAAGAHAARCVRGASARRGSGHRRARRRPAGAGSAPPAQPARFRAADPPAVERPLLRDDHRRRLGLQPLERPRDHALARRRDARRHGQLPAAARRGNRPRVVRRLPALRRPARQLRSELHRGSRRDHPHRRRHHHHARSAGVARRTTPKCGCCRSATARCARARSKSPRMPSWCSAPQAADVAHPAFSKMFVRTEFLAAAERAARQPPAPRAR